MDQKAEKLMIEKVSRMIIHERNAQNSRHNALAKELRRKSYFA